MTTYAADLGYDAEGTTLEELPLPTDTDHILDSDPQEDNNLRAMFGVVALRAYAARTKSEDEPVQTILSDLIGDLMHLADALDLTFEGLVDSASVHYEAELRGAF